MWRYHSNHQQHRVKPYSNCLLEIKWWSSRPPLDSDFSKSPSNTSDAWETWTHTTRTWSGSRPATRTTSQRSSTSLLFGRGSWLHTSSWESSRQPQSVRRATSLSLKNQTVRNYRSSRGNTTGVWISLPQPETISCMVASGSFLDHFRPILSLSKRGESVSHCVAARVPRVSHWKSLLPQSTDVGSRPLYTH